MLSFKIKRYGSMQSLIATTPMKSRLSKRWSTHWSLVTPVVNTTAAIRVRVVNTVTRNQLTGQTIFDRYLIMILVVPQKYII